MTNRMLSSKASCAGQGKPSFVIFDIRALWRSARTYILTDVSVYAVQVKLMRMLVSCWQPLKLFVITVN